MPDDDSKAAAVTVFEDSTFPFAYDVKYTAPGEVSDPGHFDVKGFRPDTKVTVEMQVHSRKFKPRGGIKEVREI